MFVSDILTAKGGLVHTIPPETTVAQAASQLTTRRIGSLLVLDKNGDVIGIVSERDLVRAFTEHDHLALARDVTEIMTRDVVSCDPDDLVDDVLAIMTNGRFRHVPVVRHGDLYGLISIGDVVKARLEEAAKETEALRNYIVTG